jgi:hypothetical protein
MRVILCILASVLFAAAPALAQEEGNRYALVIGNNSYTVSPLQNAVNDARVVEKALKDAGFRTTLVENSNLVALQQNVGDFLARLGPADTALFFYAGHGLQIENENFLVPVDFQQASSVVAAKFRLFSVAQLFDGLKNRSRRSLVVLDACRSNPIAQENSLTAGLAQPQNAPNESYVVYSTGPGQTAADNPNGHNSYFSEALAVEIAKPGLTIEEVINHVRATVSSETGSKQTPWALSSLKSTFFFHPPANVESESAASLSLKWLADAKRFEQREEWDDALDRIGQIIRRKPGGTIQATAESLQSYLAARRDAHAAYGKREYAAAAAAYEKAFQLDPFAIDAAFEGVDSYLQAEKIEPAVLLLRQIRVRGATDSTQKAVKMLAELKTVDQAAAAEAAANVPAPPPIEEMFSSFHFGTPDWDGGKRARANAPTDLSRPVKDLEAKYPPPAAATETANGDPSKSLAADVAAIAQLLKTIFHVEVTPSSETRDLVIRRANTGTLTENSGIVDLQGLDPSTVVVYQGRLLHLPASLTLQAGKYEIRSVDKGDVLTTQTIEVTAGVSQKITIKR